MPIARQRLSKHITDTTNMQATLRLLPFLFNGALNTIIEEAAFSMWFAYIHCWAADMFSVRSDPTLYKEKPTIFDSSTIT
jgi:hypothetical protein